MLSLKFVYGKENQQIARVASEVIPPVGAVLSFPDLSDRMHEELDVVGHHFVVSDIEYVFSESESYFILIRTKTL